VADDMCGRFSLSGDLDFYAAYFGAEPIPSESLEPSWNVAPTDPVYIVAERDHLRRIGAMRWGLVPHWSPDRRSIHINARVETVATAPPFRDSFARKRCLLPADGFYEWESPERGRVPHWIYRADGYPMAFAGLWSAWKDPASGEWLRTVAIITTKAEGPVAAFHHRMPVCLPPVAWDEWLSREVIDPRQAAALLRSIDQEELMERAVSSKVNSVRNNGPDLILPAGQGRLL
jgi:putative SOS response-associated peptidase YedK